MTDQQRRPPRPGFTVIELVAVVAITVTLATALTLAMSSARRSARDVKRVEDLRRIRQALQLHYADHGVYPAPVFGGQHDTPVKSTDSEAWSAFQQALAPYMSFVPTDPLNQGAGALGGGSYFYFYYSATTSGVLPSGVDKGQRSDGGYLLATRFEQGSHPLRCALKSYIDQSAVDLGSTSPLCPPNGYSLGWDDQNLYADH